MKKYLQSKFPLVYQKPKNSKIDDSKYYITVVSNVDSSFRNLNSTTYDEMPATANFLLSGQNDNSCTENRSSSLPSVDLDRAFSNTLAVFSLYNTCRLPALASQNRTLPSVCLNINRVDIVVVTNSVHTIRDPDLD